MKPPMLASLTVRIDKWLWAARFFKTRALAQDMLEKGQVLRLRRMADQHVVTERIKPSYSVQVNDMLSIVRAEECFVIHVLALSNQRGNASIAQQLYQETAESVQARQLLREQRALMPIPKPEKRPDKRDRARIIRFQRI